MPDPIIDPVHAIPAASQLRRSRFRWRIVAFVALVIAILAGAGRFATENGYSGDSIARVVIDGAIATDPERLKIALDVIAQPLGRGASGAVQIGEIREIREIRVGHRGAPSTGSGSEVSRVAREARALWRWAFAVPSVHPSASARSATERSCR